jgi:hypothetical protein
MDTLIYTRHSKICVIRVANLPTFGKAIRLTEFTIDKIARLF